MGLIKSFFYDFKNIFTIDDQMITILCASLFMPFPLTVITIIGVAIYVLVKSDFQNNVRQIRRSKWLISLPIYLLVVSLISQNYIGAIISIGMSFMFIDVIYYRKYIHKELFEIVIDMMIILSIISVVFSVFEQFYYLNTVEGMTSFFDIQNKPQYRVKAFYFNSNYYAMMIIFVEAFCVYRFMDVDNLRKRILYTLAGLANLFALFLTGGRIAWLCLGIALIFMVLANKWYKTFVAAIIAVGGGAGLLALKPNLLPRLASQGLAIGRRTEIWKTASLIIGDHFIFGIGPLGYYTYWPKYLSAYKAKFGLAGLKKYKTLGISSQHAHSMFIEPFISFGLVGTVVLLVYIGSEIHRLIRLFTRNIDAVLGSLILGILIMSLLFCIIDFPLLWVQTGMLFLLILGSSDIYRKELV